MIEPNIIVKLGHQAPVLAVRWVDEGRHLASLGRDGSLVLWNAATGTILDHAQVPLDPALHAAPLDSASTDAPLRFHAFSDGPDAGTLSIVYAGKQEDDAAAACQGAHQPGTRWCTYAFDLATRVVSADSGIAVQEADHSDDWSVPLISDRREV